MSSIVGHLDLLESSAWLEEDNDEFVDNVLHLIRMNHKFSASMFLGDLLPDESDDERNDSSDIGSNDETFVEDHTVPPKAMPRCPKTVKEKGNVGINDALKQFVDMKVKRSENRLMKAIAESESRVIEMLTKAMSGPGKEESCVQSLLVQRRPPKILLMVVPVEVTASSFMIFCHWLDS